ncbi:MAG TPA: class II aldolase/adducin family protein [Candidatus Angelobacter sp.]
MEKTLLSWLLTRRGFLIGGSLALADVLYGMQGGKTPEAPKSAGPASPELLQDLVAANRILAGQGVVDGYGHVSVRHNLNSSRYLLSRSLAPELVTVDDILEYDLDSVPVDPRGRAQYLERFIHGEIYRIREDVKAIVHNHSPSIIPFGVSAVPLRPMYHMSAFIGEGIPVFDIRDFAGMSDMLVRNPALGHSLATILGNKPAALMRGHGAVVVGASLPIVVGRSVYLEINARLQSQAVALGGPIKYLSPEEAQKATPPDNYQRAWELWKRKSSIK